MIFSEVTLCFIGISRCLNFHLFCILFPMVVAGVVVTGCTSGYWRFICHMLNGFNISLFLKILSKDSWEKVFLTKVIKDISEA